MIPLFIIYIITIISSEIIYIDGLSPYESTTLYSIKEFSDSDFTLKCNISISMNLYSIPLLYSVSSSDIDNYEVTLSNKLAFQVDVGLTLSVYDIFDNGYCEITYDNYYNGVMYAIIFGSITGTIVVIILFIVCIICMLSCIYCCCIKCPCSRRSREKDSTNFIMLH